MLTKSDQAVIAFDHLLTFFTRLDLGVPDYDKLTELLVDASWENALEREDREFLTAAIKYVQFKKGPTHPNQGA